jgi:hypothetical protein
MFSLLAATKVSRRDGTSILNLSAKFIDRFIIESLSLFVMKLIVNSIRIEGVKVFDGWKCKRRHVGDEFMNWKTMLEKNERRLKGVSRGSVRLNSLRVDKLWLEAVVGFILE